MDSNVHANAVIHRNQLDALGYAIRLNRIAKRGRSYHIEEKGCTKKSKERTINFFKVELGFAYYASKFPITPCFFINGGDDDKCTL